MIETNSITFATPLFFECRHSGSVRILITVWAKLGSVVALTNRYLYG